MTTRQGLTVVGQVIGAYFGPVGSAIGGAIGGYIGGEIDGPQKGPRLDDTNAPAIEFGAKCPRVFGRVWVTLSPLWWSKLRESTVNSGGKGAADQTTDNYVYHCDLLGRLADGSNVLDWTRIRIDGKIEATQLASSSAESIAASQTTERWSDVELRRGGPTQTPWSVMEAAEGVGNVSAYRDQCTFAITNLLMPNGRNPSLIEVEVVTAANIDPTTRQVYDFNGGGFDSLSGDPASREVVYNSTPYDRPNGDWEILIRNFVCSESANTVNNNILKWRSNPDVFAYWIFVYLYGTQGQLRVSFGGSESIHGPDMPVGDIKITFAEATNVATLYVISGGIEAEWGSVVAASASTPGGTPFTSEVVIGPGLNGGYHTAYALDGATITVGEYATVEPLPVDLQDVLESEMLRCAPLTAAHIDMSAAAGKEVWGFKASRSAAAECAVLLDWYYLDIFCGDKITVVERGGPVEQIIPYAYTGSAIDGTSDPFAGLIRGADVESQFATSVQYINILADGEVDTQQSQRVGTGSEVRAVNFSIYSKPTLAKGRADTITQDTRVAAHTATVHLGAIQAASIQPGSVLTLVDDKGNSYRTRVLRLVWNRGVYDVDICLDDPNILSTVGITTEVDTSVIEVAPAAVAEFLPLDIPRVSDAQNAPGYLALVKSGDATAVRWFDSPDNVTYSAAFDFAYDAVFGRVTAASGSFGQGVLVDEGSSLTVNVGAGRLASATRAALLADRGLNLFAVGLAGRMVLGQFRTVTLVSAGVYTLGGFVNMGAKGTEQYCASIAAGDHFAMLGIAGTAQIPRSLTDLGVPFFVKAVAFGASLDNVTAVGFTANGVNLKPLSPVALRVARDVATGDIEIRWTRQTRGDTRFGGPLGDSCPIGETVESYDVELRNPSNVLVSTDTVTSPSWSASGVANLGSFTYSARDIKIVGGDAIGIDILSEQASSTGQVHFCQFDAATGALILISAVAMGASCEQWTSIGDDIYAATTDFYAVSGSLRASHVHRLTRGVMNIEATFDATYSPGTADGYISGIAADGTDVWITEYFSGTLRKLHPTTLASVATYSLGAGISEIQYAAGSLWIVNRDTHEMIEWDIATTSEVNRFNLNNPGGPTKVIGGLLFNFGGPIGGGVGGALHVYNATTGALVNTIDNLIGRGSIVEFGGEIVCQANGPTLYFIDSATGLQTRTVNASDLGYYANADGSDGTNLYVTAYSIGGSLLGTYIVDLDAADLSGFSVTVYQNGQLGRGYPATLEIA